jgi:hypothetical protein
MRKVVAGQPFPNFFWLSNRNWVADKLKILIFIKNHFKPLTLLPISMGFQSIYLINYEATFEEATLGGFAIM